MVAPGTEQGVNASQGVPPGHPIKTRSLSSAQAVQPRAPPKAKEKYSATSGDDMQQCECSASSDLKELNQLIRVPWSWNQATAVHLSTLKAHIHDGLLDDAGCFSSCTTPLTRLHVYGACSASSLSDCSWSASPFCAPLQKCAARERALCGCGAWQGPLLALGGHTCALEHRWSSLLLVKVRPSQKSCMQSPHGSVM